jgi:2-polyprenyl-3-methyl-5-hydroxy-6-metoxy-1,4-benzoquinol methylase
VVRCPTCGLLRTDPRPTLDTIGYYYPDDYSPFQGTRVNAAAPLRVRPWWWRLARRGFEFNATSLPPLEPGRMLEIGCASGSFLHRMAQAGWDVSGIEPSPTAGAAAAALGYPVQIGPLETAHLPDGQYDLVVGWMVLEHLHEPIDVLRILHRAVTPGGWLVCSMPNAASLPFKLFGNVFYGLMLPHHLYHFTPRSLEQVLAAAGWQMRRLMHQRTVADWIMSTGLLLEEHGYHGALARGLRDYFLHPSRMEYVLYPLAYALSLFGQNGRMTVWAQKPQ